jgi:hypothetical protein
VFLFWNRFSAITTNVLRAREGRETNALNCKPITNLKEKYELSNYSKTSGFILHAVMCCQPTLVYLRCLYLVLHVSTLPVLGL